MTPRRQHAVQWQASQSACSPLRSLLSEASRPVPMDLDDHDHHSPHIADPLTSALDLDDQSPFLVHDRSSRLRNTESVVNTHAGPSSRSLPSLDNDPSSFLDLLKVVSRKVDENARSIKRETSRILEEQTASRTASEAWSRNRRDISRPRNRAEMVHRSSIESAARPAYAQEPVSSRKVARIGSGSNFQSEANTPPGTNSQSRKQSDQGPLELACTVFDSQAVSGPNDANMHLRPSRSLASPAANTAHIDMIGNKHSRISSARPVQTPITPPADPSIQTPVAALKSNSQQKSSHSRTSHPPPLGMRRNSHIKPSTYQQTQSGTSKRKEFRPPLPHPPEPPPSNIATHAQHRQRDPSLPLTCNNTLPTPDSTPSRAPGLRSSSHPTMSVDSHGELPVEDSVSPPSEADSSFGDISFGIESDVLEQAMREYDNMVLT